MRAKIEMPKNCGECARRVNGKCIAYTEYIRNCSSFTSDRKKVIKELETAMDYVKNTNNFKTKKEFENLINEIKREEKQQIMEAYNEDRRRGAGGSNSESDSNNKASIKAKMKDNRALETKSTQAEREEYARSLREWEEANGPLERLRPDDGMTRKKIDSYTGEEIQ